MSKIFFFALNDSNCQEIIKKNWALSFIAVIFVKFAVVFMNSTANMTKTTAMDTLPIIGKSHKIQLAHIVIYLVSIYRVKLILSFF